jgi:hypothetical protein
LSDAELGWITDYATWSDRFYRQLVREAEARGEVLGDTAGADRYRQETVELRDCASGIDQLGDTPPRLGPTLRAVRRMCGSVADASTRLVDAAPEARMDAFVRMNEAGSGVYLEVQRLDEALDELTLARGKLPRLGGSGSARTSRVEPALTAVSARVADGRAIEVRCWSADDWKRVLDEESALTLGAMTVDTIGAFAQPLTGTVHLQQEQCAPLVRLTEGARVPDDDDLYDVAFAVGTLSHEIQHVVAPGASEAGTECAAVQHNAEVARELGVSAGEARKIADLYWEAIYPEEEDGYQTADCAPGGVLDLAPETDAWPTG